MARSNNEFLGAVAVGTLLGVAAALALRPSPRSARERLLRELQPYRQQLRDSAAGARRAVEAATHAAEELAHDGGDASEDAIGLGRELLAEFREEVRRVLEEARAELAVLAEAEAPGGSARRARWELEERLERRLGRRGARYGGEEPPDDADELDDEER